jgi:hypothetical protein
MISSPVYERGDAHNTAEGETVEATRDRERYQCARACCPGWPR